MWVQLVATAAADLAELVLPATCPGCESPGVGPRRPWCESCAPEVVHRWVLPSPVPLGFPKTVRCGEYADQLRRAILAHKDGTRRDLGRDLGTGLASAAGWAGFEEARLVPVPSTRSARRSRGFDHTLDLARKASRSLPGSTVMRLLSVAAGEADQGGRNAAERANRRNAFKLGRRVAGCGPLVLVDDVATTGWTLASAAGVLGAAGFEVAGAVVVASTLLRRGDPASGS